MQTSHHTLYPATAEIHHHMRQHDLTEVVRLATNAREAETRQPRQSLLESDSPQESSDQNADNGVPARSDL